MLSTLLARYLSPLNAQSVLANALRRRGLTPTQLVPGDVARMAPDLQRGVALFGTGDPERFRRELLQLVAETDGGDTSCGVDISNERDVIIARNEAVQLCARLGASRFATQRVATVVGELARNIASYTPGGRIEVVRGDNGAVVVRAKDRGSGIPNVEEILAGRYKSSTGLGLGLAGTKRLAELFSIQTSPEGTSVEVHLKL